LLEVIGESDFNFNDQSQPDQQQQKQQADVTFPANNEVMKVSIWFFDLFSNLNRFTISGSEEIGNTIFKFEKSFPILFSSLKL